MKKTTLIGLMLCGVLCMQNASAGRDPIGWSLSPSTGFPAQTTVGSSYSVTYTLTNNLPVAIPLTMSNTYKGNTYVVDDQCQNKTLAPNATCQVHIGFQPAQEGAHSTRLIIGYGHNRVPLPYLSSNSTGNKTTDKVEGFVSTPLPPNTQTGTTYPVVFTFKNDGDSSVTATAVTPTGFTPTTNTCTSPIASHATCTVEGSMNSSVTGQASLGVTYAYTSGSAKTVVLSTTTNISGSGGSCTQVTGQSVLPLPLSTFVYSDNIVKFKFTNHCDVVSETLGAVSIAATMNGTPVSNVATQGTTTVASDACTTGKVLAPNESCSVYVSVIPTTTGNSLAIEASIPYNSGANTARAISSEQVTDIPHKTTAHNITFVNQCDFPVWYEFANGNGSQAVPPAQGYYSPDPTPSTANKPSDYLLPAAIGGVPSTKTLSVTRYENGKIYGRTGCDSNMVCNTASCQVISGTGTCVVGTGAGAPNTAFEAYMTDTLATDGVYDVSVINGMNVPVAIKGLGPVSSTDPYACTSAGALIQPATAFNPPLGACSWQFTPPNSGIDNTGNYVFVSAGSQPVSPCTDNSDCTGTDVCGMGWNTNINTGAGTPINRRCGTFQGYWTVADFIGYSGGTDDWGSVSYNLYNTYQIANPLSSAYYNLVTATNFNLYGCVPTDNDSLDSGYKAGKSRVCGCYDWDKAGSPALTNVTQKCCTGVNDGPECNAQAGVVDAPNPLWLTTVFDRIKWLKTACPTAYSYQFDDKSSSFQCNQSGQFTSYQVVFCPGGKKGNN